MTIHRYISEATVAEVGQTDGEWFLRIGLFTFWMPERPSTETGETVTVAIEIKAKDDVVQTPHDH